MTMTYPTSAELARTRRNGGFGVVELMVAMAISLLLLGGVVTLFTSSKTTYERVEHLSRIQETGRFALEAIDARHPFRRVHRLRSQLDLRQHAQQRRHARL